MKVCIDCVKVCGTVAVNIGGGRAVGGGTTASAVAVIPCGKALKLTSEFGTACVTIVDCDCLVTVVVCGCV